MWLDNVIFEDKRTHGRVRAPFLGALTGAVAAGAAALLTATPVHSPAPQRVAQEGALVKVAEQALVAPEAMAVGTLDNRAQPVALDMPRKPFKGQYRPDKDGTCKGRLEVPIHGGCWVALRLAPPCGTDAYEYEGVCYWPSAPAAKNPSSTAPRTTPAPAERAR